MGRRGGRGFRLTQALTASQWGEWPGLVSKELLLRFVRERAAPDGARPCLLACVRNGAGNLFHLRLDFMPPRPPCAGDCFDQQSHKEQGVKTYNR